MSHAVQIAALNDRLRTKQEGGRAVTTRSVLEHGAGFIVEAMKAIRHFDTFTPDNDPHQEHDFGSVVVRGTQVFWKIDYYANADCEAGSEAPWDETASYRVLTVMLAEDL